MHMDIFTPLQHNRHTAPCRHAAIHHRCRHAAIHHRMMATATLYMRGGEKTRDHTPPAARE